MWEALLSLKALRSFPSRCSLSRLSSICMNRSHAMRYIIVYSPECVEDAILEVGLPFYPILGSPILGVLRIVWHDGYFRKPSGS
jgi:hypothetical protein